MTLLSLLIAMALERVLLPSKSWQFSTYFAPYLALLRQWQFSQTWFQQIWGLGVIAAIPTLATWFLLRWVEGALFGLLSLLVSVLVLMLAMGCLTAREQYKKFLRAACRGDEEACYIVAQSLGASTNEPELAESSDDEPLDVSSAHKALEEGVGQTLTWVNYRYYIAVMIWLILFGIPGVVFYSCLRTLVDIVEAESAVTDEHEKSEAAEPLDATQRLMAWLDFIPVRIASLGLTLVGNFSKAMPVWLENLLNSSDTPKAHLVRVSLAAEEIHDPENPTCVASVTKFVEMAKRNVLLMLSLIAILTLYGSLS